MRKNYVKSENWKPSGLGRIPNKETREKMRQAKIKNPTRYWLGKKRDPALIEKMTIMRVRKLKGRKRPLSERIAMSKRAPKGENHHWWRGGVSDKNEVERRTLEYKLWREAVFKRDNWTCQDCGHRNKKGNIKNLNAHHIKSFSKHKELRTSIENGKTLCEDCHKKLKSNKQEYGNSKI